MKTLPNPKAWGVKTTHRSKNRMKLTLKLSQEETEAFTSFANSVKPEGLSLDEFVRSIFFAGVRTLEEQLTSNLVKHIEENREQYEASGFTFDEEGKLSGVAQGEGDSEIIEADEDEDE